MHHYAENLLLLTLVGFNIYGTNPASPQPRMTVPSALLQKLGFGVAKVDLAQRVVMFIGLLQLLSYR